LIFRILLLALGCAAVGWSVRQWRVAIQAAMVLLVFEGAIRKWLLPGSQDLVYFAKDALFLGAYVGFLRSGSRRWPLPQAPMLYAALVASVVLGMFQVLNPMLPNVLVGVLGFKSYFLYVPLLFVVPAVFRDDAELALFLKRYVLIIFPVVLLSVAQFFSPAGSVLNTYAQPTESNAISTFGSSNFVRTTGTFSYISGYTSYLLATTILILMILTTTRWRFKGNLVTFAALGAVMLGIMMSGSRGPVFLLALAFPIYWWLGVVREKQGGQTVIRLLLGVGLLVAGLTSAGDQAVTAFSQRASSHEDLSYRVTYPFTSPVHMLSYSGLFGFGIGATHQAASALTGGVENPSLINITPEAESGRVMLEIGPVGFFFVYFARFAVAAFTLRQALRLRTLFHRAVATSALLIFIVQIPGGIVFDVTSGVYYWFLTGLVFLVVRLDRRVQVPAARLGAATKVAPAPAIPADVALPLPRPG
jgi:hypothetical protein